MDPILLIVIIPLGVIAIYQYCMRLKIEDDYTILRDDILNLFSAIERSKMDDKFIVNIPSNELSKRLYCEFLKKHLKIKENDHNKIENKG